MYPLHKYLPTPFGTYLLYIDNGPTRVRVNKDRPQLPTYQALKEHGRQQRQEQQRVSKYQAFQKPVGPSTTAPGLVQHSQTPMVSRTERKKQSYTPSSTMPNSIWSPKVKRMHLSYNMRQLWHSGQPVKDPPSKVIEVDEVTGAEMITEAQWHRDRLSKEHEEIKPSPGTYDVKEHRQSKLFMDSAERTRSAAQGDGQPRIFSGADMVKSSKSRPKVPPNTAANSPVLSEAYKRQASQLRNDMVPRRQKKPKRASRRHHRDREGFLNSAHQNKETQTSPIRFSKTSMEYTVDDIMPGVTGLSSPRRSSSVPVKTPSEDNRSRNCVEKTGLPPIMETEPHYIHETNLIPKAVTVETDTWRQRVRRVQEFRSASPTFPIKSKGEFWDEISKGRMPNASSHSLLPFTWQEQKRNRSTEIEAKQKRNLEVEKILPVITRMPSIPRV